MQRGLFIGIVLMMVALAHLACERRGDDAAGGGRVVLYCSVDGDVARPILDAFTKETGIRVDAVFDTEATKTTGLVNRLLSEKGAPRADVWWSSEPYGTIRLSRAGVLETFTTRHTQDFRTPSLVTGETVEAGWPKHLRASDRTWYGFAERTRQVVWHTEHVTAERVPRTLEDLTDPRWKGRVAMARPQFGTTRGHMAAIAMFWGEAGLERWLTAMRGNDVRIVDGNAAVVRAVASGEAWVGLTDNDDVVSGQANGWKVKGSTILDVIDAGAAKASAREMRCFSVSVPGTVAVVKGGPNERAGRELANFLLSVETEDALARSVFQTGRLRPIRTRLGDGPLMTAPCPEVSLENVADHVEPAMRVCERVLN